MNNKQLMTLAEKALHSAYSPYSMIKVGAAILTMKGNVFTGCNVENSSHGLTICAERTAIVKAVSEGHRDFAAIAVASDKKGGVTPCGACLQSLFEFSPDMKIFIKGKNGKLFSSSLRKLLPRGFRLNERSSR